MAADGSTLVLRRGDVSPTRRDPFLTLLCGGLLVVFLLVTDFSWRAFTGTGLLLLLTFGAVALLGVRGIYRTRVEGETVLVDAAREVRTRHRTFSAAEVVCARSRSGRAFFDCYVTVLVLENGEEVVLPGSARQRRYDSERLTVQVNSRLMTWSSSVPSQHS